MAGILYLTEYAQLTQLAGDAGQMPDENTKTAEQAIAVGAGSTQSAILNPGTKYVRVGVDSTNAMAVLIAFGTAGTPPNPTAVIGNQRFAPNQTEYKGVPSNGNGSGNARVQVMIAAIPLVA